MIIASILFYVFATVMVCAALGVIMSKNPVYSVLLLILTFFNAAGLFVLLGAELIAMMLVIVYVGAVAVLFLFVVMMLNIKLARIKNTVMSYLPFGAAIVTLLFAELAAMLFYSSEKLQISEAPSATVAGITNTQAIGQVLYTDYMLPFQLSGLILLVAMIGAIVLTHRKRPGVRRQNISTQIARNAKTAVRAVKVRSGQGVA